jgi:hypothetical protein
MTNFKTMIAIGLGASLLATSVAAEDRPNRVRASGSNGTVTAVQGEKGSAARARGAKRNDNGSVTAASGGAFKTATGARGARGSTTTVNPDGSGSRVSGASASGARGSASTSSDVTRNADGTFSGGRTTKGTSAATGNTYNGSTQIDPSTGKPVRTATCTDASGAVIACPL